MHTQRGAQENQSDEFGPKTRTIGPHFEGGGQKKGECFLFTLPPWILSDFFFQCGMKGGEKKNPPCTTPLPPKLKKILAKFALTGNLERKKKTFTAMAQKVYLFFFLLLLESGSKCHVLLDFFSFAL